MPKRKQSAAASAIDSVPLFEATSSAPLQGTSPIINGTKRRKSARPTAPRTLTNGITNPDLNDEVLDGVSALRASPDSSASSEFAPAPQNESVRHESTPLSDVPDVQDTPKKKQTRKKKAAAAAATTPPKLSKSKKEKSVTTVKTENDTSVGMATKTKPKSKQAAAKQATEDPEADEEDEAADPDDIQEALRRPPPVNSSYLPLPWKGRLGYACLNTYLRYSNPPVFCSRTTRIASILEHRHPLKDPSQPHHPTKNRPDLEQPADPARGMAFVQSLALANVRDMAKLIRWNDRYGIRFLRLSSEAFPFASHAEYGYKLAPFAAEALAQVGAVAAELGHRLTTHPGQFTQLGSPRPEVIKAAIRDLEYHDEMLTLLKLPPQQDRDAIMVLHMGGAFGDKAATLDRFRTNYARLPPSIKRRLVLENDDVSWSVHDLLPICEELNIPLVLDFHHHNIIFDAARIREGTLDIRDLYPAILATWTRKQITPKMHYSEATPAAITGHQRRKHSPRVATLPPCPDTMDLMIEAKDKEQAVLELMRTFKLPGWDSFANMIPHVRQDDNKFLDMPSRQKKVGKATPKKRKRAGKNDDGDGEVDVKEEEVEADADAAGEAAPGRIPDEDVGMGGPLGRVYWPPTMEEWLRPVKRVVKKKETAIKDED